MIRVLGGMPVGVLGVEAVGDVEDDDYRNVLHPAVENLIAGGDRDRRPLGPAGDQALQAASSRPPSTGRPRSDRTGEPLTKERP